MKRVVEFPTGVALLVESILCIADTVESKIKGEDQDVTAIGYVTGDKLSWWYICEPGHYQECVRLWKEALEEK